MPPLQSRAGTPRRIPGPSCTLYALRPSFVDAAAARNGLKDLYLFAILFDPMADEDGAVHAGTGAHYSARERSSAPLRCRRDPRWMGALGALDSCRPQ